MLFGARHDGIRTPGAEGSEPQIPVEARLVGRIDARSLVRILRLVAEGVCKPSLAVVRTLKFDFVAAASHNGEEAVAVCDAERLERGNWRRWEWRAGPDHPEEENGAGVKEAREDYGGGGGFDKGKRRRGRGRACARGPSTVRVAGVQRGVGGGERR